MNSNKLYVPDAVQTSYKLLTVLGCIRFSSSIISKLYGYFMVIFLIWGSITTGSNNFTPINYGGATVFTTVSTFICVGNMIILVPSVTWHLQTKTDHINRLLNKIKKFGSDLLENNTINIRRVEKVSISLATIEYILILIPSYLYNYGTLIQTILFHGSSLYVAIS